MNTQQETLRRTALMPRYHAWIVDKVRQFLGERILEVGCGTGAITGHLLATGAHVVGVDIQEDYLVLCRQTFAQSAFFTARRCDVQSDEFRGLADLHPDTVMCSNVLEHIADDQGAVCNMADVLTPGGHMIIIAPALRWLWGSLDEGLSHCRRYEKHDMRQLLEEAGLEVMVLRYFNLLGLLGWFVNGKLLRRRVLPGFQLRAYDCLVPVFRWIENTIRPHLGQSLIAVGRKPDAVSVPGNGS